MGGPVPLQSTLSPHARLTQRLGRLGVLAVTLAVTPVFADDAETKVPTAREVPVDAGVEALPTPVAAPKPVQTGAIDACVADGAVEAAKAAGTSTPQTSEALPASLSSPEGTPLGSEAALEQKLEGMGEELPVLHVPHRSKEPPLTSARSLPRERDLLAQAYKAEGHYKVGKGDTAHPLTLDPSLQDQLTRTLENYRVPFGAVVALDPSTGRVLAMAEHSQVRPDLRGLSVQALFPAASIFKLVTATALLSEGISPATGECFHGGKRKLDEKLLGDSERDGLCYSLSEALGRSANVIFAKMTVKHLTAAKLKAAAESLGFNRPLPFDVPTGMSLAAVPEDTFGLATAGAGFGDVYLSPLHGAVLAAAIANKGVWHVPFLISREGAAFDAAANPGQRVMTEAQAEALTGMMEETVTHGTARRVFQERGHHVPGAVGKTGSLADKNPFRDYSWFVGFAPRDNPKVAVAAVIVNEPLWHIRATWLGREALRLYLEGLAKPQKGSPATRRPTR